MTSSDNSQNDSTELRGKIEQLHAYYITEHLRELDRLKPSMVRQYKLEAEINKVPTKFIKDLMNLITHYGIEQRIEELEELLGQQDHEGCPVEPTSNNIKDRLAELEKKKGSI